MSLLLITTLTYPWPLVFFNSRFGRCGWPRHKQMQIKKLQSKCPNNVAVGIYTVSHAHTVVWECCKDDRQSQWGMAKFDPQPTLNPWTDRHQIWNTWLCRGYLPALGLPPPQILHSRPTSHLSREYLGSLLSANPISDDGIFCSCTRSILSSRTSKFKHSLTNCCSFWGRRYLRPRTGAFPLDPTGGTPQTLP